MDSKIANNGTALEKLPTNRCLDDYARSLVHLMGADQRSSRLVTTGRGKAMVDSVECMRLFQRGDLEGGSQLLGFFRSHQIKK